MSDALQSLNTRGREVLRLIVDAYLETGEPVGSRTLSRRLGMSISPATIRNVMADLQEAGLLYAPHTSAGRLPTEAGLRLFVDGLLESGRLDEEDRRRIASQCAAQGKSVQQVLEEATRVLSGLSNCAGLVIAPKAEAPIKHIEFVALGPGRALVVLVSEDGQVENRVIQVPVGLPTSALVEASNFLSAQIVGKTVSEARAGLEVELEEHRRALNELTRRLVDTGIATWTNAGDRSALIVAGTNRLLDDVTAVEDLARVRAVFSALETKEGLVKLLEATADAEGVQIFIGAQNELFGLAGCSLIVAPYMNSREQIIGALGVIGPTRIDYARIIPVVDYTSKVVGRVLGHGEGGEAPK